MTSGYAQVAGGFWPAVVIGGIELWIAMLYTTAGARHALRRCRDAGAGLSRLGRSDEPPVETLLRCWRLIAEAIIVRERVSGQIDAATYRRRMEDLVSGRRS